MKTLILLTISLISISIFAKEKQDPYDVLQKRIDKFYGKKINEMNKENPMLPNKALYSKGSCLKFNKNGENFWTKYETMTIRIDDIGLKNLKIRKIYFMSDKKWLVGPPETMVFEAQNQFTETDCPSEKMKLTIEEIEDLKKENKINVK